MTTTSASLKPALPSWPPRRDWKQTEYNLDPVGFHFNFLFAYLALKIIERDVGGSVPMGAAVSDPRYILDELGGTDSREAYPKPTFIKRKHAAAPAQNLSRLSAHLVQVNLLFHPQSFSVDDDDMAINCGEIDFVSCNVPIMRPLHRDIDAWTGGGQANRVALLEACDPDFLVELKHVIRVRPVGLGRGDLAIVRLPRESYPRIFA